MEGKIGKVFESYGFIKMEGVEGIEKDLFFHQSEAQGFDSLKPGDMVEFEIGQGRKGDRVAVRVTKMVTKEE